MSKTFYNDSDKKVAAWLSELVAQGHVSDGDVDTRSIADLTAADVQDRERVHLFAGIGGWDYALKLAGWPEGVPVWTGSCPCQPFSSAGKGKGVDDERHLWPEMRRLIDECRPPFIFGEQVASKSGRAWLAGVRTDLEALGYGVGAADLCAAGTGAPHIRQRLWWVAYAPDRLGNPAGVGQCGGPQDRPGQPAEVPGAGCEGACRLAQRNGPRPQGWPRDAERPDQRALGADGVAGRLVHTQHGRPAEQEQGQEPWRAGAWGEYDLIPCRDGKQRRVEPGSFPLAHGLPARVGRLRGYGNAIVPQVAAIFIRSFMEATA